MNLRLLVRITLLVCSALGAGVAFTGCNTAPKTAAASPAATSDDDYVTYLPTGSMLTRRVKRSEVPKEYLQVENSDSPTLRQMEKTQLIRMTPRSR